MEKTHVVKEHVLYLGAFNDPAKHPLFSHRERGVVELHRLDAIREAFLAGKAEPVLSVSCRTCTFPLHPDSGARLALGSTCDEQEVTS